MVRPLVFDMILLLLDMLLDKPLEILSFQMKQYHGEGQLHGLVELTQVKKKAETCRELIYVLKWSPPLFQGLKFKRDYR